MKKTEHCGYWGDLAYIITEPTLLAESTPRRPRFECMLKLYIPHKKTAVCKKRLRFNSKEKCLAEAEAAVEPLIRENKEKLYALIREGKYNPTLDTYFNINIDEIIHRSSLGLSKKEYQAVWNSEKVKKTYKSRLLLDKIDETEIAQLVEQAYESSRRKKRKTDAETALNIILYDIFCYACFEEFIDFNPLESQVAKYRETEETRALSRNARAHMSWDELVRYTKFCVEKINAGQIEFAAALLCCIAGFTVSEVCGLNWSDWRQSTYYALRWIAVVRMFWQKRRRTPTVDDKLRVFQYRRFPCTDLIDWVLAVTFMSSESNQVEVFRINGTRLEPDCLKSVINKVLTNTLDEGGRLGISKRHRAGDLSRQISNGEFLRTSFDYYMRNFCKLPSSSFYAFLGLKPKQTYSKHYVDWKNTTILLGFRLRLEVWHYAICASIEQGTSLDQTLVWTGYHYLYLSRGDDLVGIKNKYGACMHMRKL